VSQFTLYGILKGNKPDFHVAMPPAKAKPFYASLVEKFQNSYKADLVKGKCDIASSIMSCIYKIGPLECLIIECVCTLVVDDVPYEHQGPLAKVDHDVLVDFEAFISMHQEIRVEQVHL
jgi:D-tyrosyl-tRNA(Tyr) deacylase